MSSRTVKPEIDANLQDTNNSRDLEIEYDTNKKKASSNELAFIEIFFMLISFLQQLAS